MAPTDSERMVGELVAPDISEMIQRRETRQARAALLVLADPEVADVLIELPPQQRALAFRMLPRERAADVFTFLPPENQEELLAEMTSEQLALLLDEMDPDDRAAVFEEMPGELAAKLLALMRPEERRRTQAILGYPPESVGRIMTPDYLTLRPGWTVQQALEHIRAHGQEAETLDTLYVVGERGRLLGYVDLPDLVLANPADAIDRLMDEHVVSLVATEDREEAVRAMERYDVAVLPVVSTDGALVGIVTFDDVADVAAEEVTEDFQKLGGMEALDEPYLSISIPQLVRRRGTWLTVLFLGEMATISVLTRFEAPLQEVVALAFFLPLIIASGGNSGSQAATLVIRAMALQEVRLRDWWRVLRREVACGLLMGAWLGGLGLLRVLLWHQMGWDDYSLYYTRVGLTILVAVAGVVLWGVLVGSMLPFALRRLGLDPATSSAPFVATLVDVTGLTIYLLTATWLLGGTLLP